MSEDELSIVWVLWVVMQFEFRATNAEGVG